MSLGVNQIHRAVLVSHGMLLVLILVWQVSARPGPVGIAVALLATVPLLLPWAGLVRGNRRTHAWATLCVTPYLVLGLVESVASPAARILSGACLVLAIGFFATLILYLRVTTPPRLPSVPD